MRNRRTTFLAGVATLALLAGTSFASAEEADHNGAMQSHSSTPAMKNDRGAAGAGHAQPDAKMGQGTQEGSAKGKTSQTGKMGEPEGTKGESAHGQTTQTGKMGEPESTPGGEAHKGADRANPQQGAGTNGTEMNRRADETNRGDTRKGKMDDDRAAQGERTKEGAPATAEQRREGESGTAQRQDDRMGGGRVTFNEEQRSRIRETVINAHGAPRVSSVDFDLAVGTMIPRGRVEIVPVPETLVQIQPEWRGFLYFVFRDQLVIVSPDDMRIIAVVPV